jgi:cytochrome c553
VPYFIQQIADYKSAARKGSGSMLTIAQNISDDEIKAAALYFHDLPKRQWIRVVETANVFKTYVGAGNKRLIHPDHIMEPLGNRIIEIPENEQRVLNRDPGSGFVAYVPIGSIAKGEQLAAGKVKEQACATCHGEGLKGTEDVPALAGKTATYIVRQLYMIQSGERNGAHVEAMKAIVAGLSIDDMLALAAYSASLTP